MKNYYGIYRNVRNAAWQFLLDFRIKRLPVDSFVSICTDMNVLAVSYRESEDLIRTLGLASQAAANEGFTICFEDRWTIFYNDENRSFASINFVIAHELGHILLGHKFRSADSIRSKTSMAMQDKDAKKKRDKYEREADMFAVRVLAPAFVLKELNIKDYTDIMLLCYLPKDRAIQRANRMKQLMQRDQFYKSQLELKLLKQFGPFIESVKQRQVLHTF